MPGCAVPALPMRAKCVVAGDRLGRHSGGADGAAHRAGGQPGHDEMIYLTGEQARLFQGVGHGRLGQRAVHLLAEPFLPHPRGGRAGRPPPVKELGGGAALPDDLGQHRQARAAVRASEDEGGRAVTAVPLVCAARQAGADIGEHRHSRHRRLGGGDQRAHARADGTGHVDRQRVGRQPQGGVQRRGVGLVRVGGDGGGEEQLPHAGAARLPAGPRHPSQGGAARRNRHRGGVFVEGGDRTGAGTPATAQHPRYPGALQLVVRDVGAVADEASHGTPHKLAR